MDIILFGAGEECKKALPFLEEKYSVMFLADSDVSKYGSKIGDYEVGSLERGKRNNYNIVITSTRYSFEISRQLQQQGIDQNKIYFLRKLYTDNIGKYEVCPINEEHMKHLEDPLVNFDLYHKEECKSDKKKVLVFCTFFSTYTKQLIENMSRQCCDIEFSLITRVKEYKEKIVSDKLEHIYYFQTLEELKTILIQLPLYDAMQLLWIEWEWAYFYRILKRKTRRLNLNVGGSDFYRAGEDERKFKQNLIMCADIITAETAKTVQEFGDYYGEKIRKKTHLLPFGIEVLEWIDHIENIPKNRIKEKYHIPLGKIVVTCGHNAIQQHQHLKIIDAIEKIPNDIKEQIILVFPMTYPNGADHYIEIVDERLKRTGLNYVILTKYMDYEGMAEYASISDIMIHVQTTDQLSSTMLEEMYAGAVVIAGKWLPYQSLYEMGMFFLNVDEVLDITIVLQKIIADMELYQKRCRENKEKVRKHSSWNELFSKWHDLWV